MATTKFTLTLSSDISSDTLSVKSEFNATTDGTTGLSETSGMARTVVGTSNKVLVDISAAPVDIIGTKAVLYIKNLDTTFTDYVDIRFGNAGGTYMDALRVYGGQFAVLPLSNLTDGDGAGTDVDINVIAASINTPIEYALFYTA